MKIGYQGEKGAFSYIAGINYFGRKHNFIGFNDFKSLFDGLKNRKVERIIVPIENSIAGSVYENYDNLKNYNVWIEGEYYLKISHNLLGIKADISVTKRLQMIKEVYSHPKALEQCSKFFEKFKWMKKVAFSDTASSAKFVKESGRFDLASISSIECARIYNLQVIKKDIQYNKENFTRFFIVKRGRGKIKIEKPVSKCSIIFILKHKPGSLFDFLKIFKDNNINLTKIDSRPIPNRPFEYVFFADFLLNKKDYKSIVSQLKKKCVFIKVLGAYEKHS